MSWSINLSGHSTNDEEETKRVNDLARELLAKAREAGLNPTHGSTSNNVKSLSWDELNETGEVKPLE